MKNRGLFKIRMDIKNPDNHMREPFDCLFPREQHPDERTVEEWRRAVEERKKLKSKYCNWMLN